jgi:hypothetical protein
MVVPLPAKVYLSGEEAEVIGEEYLRQALEDHPSTESANLLTKLEDPDRPLSFRTTVIQSNDFKTSLDHRGVPKDLAAIYRRMQMSRWIWTVELVDRARRNDGERFVLAEVIIDATDHVRDRHALGYRVPGVIAQWDPDADRIDLGHLDAIAPLSPVTPIGLPR